MFVDSIWPAPAKLNLFLYINGRRDDGYHELQTLFQFIDFGDSLDISISKDLRLESDLPFALNDNIVLRAAHLLKDVTKCPHGALIKLIKKLPMGAGLGGGSSDAATTLVALNHIWNTNLSKDELMQIGVKLGADVPIFIHGHASVAEGIGDKLQSVDIEQKWYLIVNPHVHINTKEIFGHEDLIRDTPKHDVKWLLKNEWSNDFEPLVTSMHPKVAKAIDWLLKYGPARLTGSGSCIFGTFDNQAKAKDALAHLPHDLSAFIAQGTNVSALEQKLTLL